MENGNYKANVDDMISKLGSPKILQALYFHAGNLDLQVSWPLLEKGYDFEKKKKSWQML